METCNYCGTDIEQNDDGKWGDQFPDEPFCYGSPDGNHEPV